MKKIGVVIKHPGRDWEGDVRIDIYEVPEDTTTEQIREACIRKMLGPFEVIYVTEKVDTSIRQLEIKQPTL